MKLHLFQVQARYAPSLFPLARQENAQWNSRHQVSSSRDEDGYARLPRSVLGAENKHQISRALMKLYVKSDRGVCDTLSPCSTRLHRFAEQEKRVNNECTVKHLA